MPKIVNTFLKSKMNKDLDARLIPNGEYRDAQNLQISRSEGSSVGEFENIIGNTVVQNGYLNTGTTKDTTAPGTYTNYHSQVIGQYTDESTGNIFIFSTAKNTVYTNIHYRGTGQTPRDIHVFTAAAGTASTIRLVDGAGNPLNPQVLGIEVGMGMWGEAVSNASFQDSYGNPGDPIVRLVTSTEIGFSWTPGGLDGALPVGDAITFGWVNTIHCWNKNTNLLSLLVRGGFLNFNIESKIYGINLLEDLLFFTDNRNQPRRINVDTALANPVLVGTPEYYTSEDQISVAKYYPYEVPLVLDQIVGTATSGVFPATVAGAVKGYEIELNTDPTALGVKIGDIVSSFPGQGAQELWEVIYIEKPGGNDRVIVYNNFVNTPGTAGAAWAGGSVTFSRPSMTNESEIKNANGFATTINAIVSPLAAGGVLTINYPFNNLVATSPDKTPTPQVGDYIISTAMGITLADEVIIQSIENITPGTTAQIKLTRSITGAVGNDITIAPNPNYNSTFTGDADLLEQKFVRFSYRFKFNDNEFSLSAPFTQICFIPKQDSIFGAGPNDSKQDMTDAYTSSILAWFENKINNINLKIPLPSIGASSTVALDSLRKDYHVKELEILYKESDQTSTKILKSLSLVNDIKSGDIAYLPNTGNKYYYTFNYKSIKPYRTLPISQSTRVYDKVPVKALAQEVTANRITYGNFIENHTPPTSIDYEALNNDKDLAYKNYAQYPNHTVKQNRNYQIGFILGDRYGRQSSVILSSNDNNEAVAGSTVYLPYKSWDNVQFASGLYTYEWLGSALRVRVNNGITQITPDSLTGEPGLYKSYDDTSVDTLTVSTAGTGYTVGDTCTTAYPFANVGLGSGFTFTVQSIDGGGGIVGITITNRGSGYANGQVLNVVGGTGTSAQVTVTVNSPNVLGWESYKLVVKQQEQDYYNVYLPGFVSGYPVLNADDTGRIAFSALFNDNINKIPRDLAEVGPLQTEFPSSIRLFGRVNNPNINNRQTGGAGVNYYENRLLPWNTQYFPGRLADEATTVGPIGQSGLELANSPFSATNASIGAFVNPTTVGATDGRLPWGLPGAEQSFYNVEQNPLAVGIKVGAEESQPQLLGTQLNTLGAVVTNRPVSAGGALLLTMNPFLSVTETAPVETQLELFYESSTSGNFVDLNRNVTADYAGVSQISDTGGSFSESDAVATVIVSTLNFEDSSGNPLTLNGVPVINQVLDTNGNIVTGSNLFIIEQDPAGVANKDFRIKTNDLFWYKIPGITTSNVWEISFETSFTTGGTTYEDSLSNAFTVSLSNSAPTSLLITSAIDSSTYTTGQTMTPTFSNTATSIGTFSGKNGSADTANDLQDLCWSIATTASPGGSTAVLSIDKCTGAVTVTSGALINGTYTITGTLTDVSVSSTPTCSTGSCVSDTASLSTDCIISFVVGTADTDQAICFGETSAMAALDTSCSAGTGKPLEVFFGVSSSVNNGTITGTTGSKTQAYLSALPGTNYGTTRGTASALDLRYYNVRSEALSTSDLGFKCGLPPANPLFTTGALTQGVLAIKARLIKSTVDNLDYTTNFTILYRADASASWSQATADARSPTSAGLAVGTFTVLNVSGAGSSEDNLEFYFTAVGEYAVCNNAVTGPGCLAAPAGTPAGCEFQVDFYDQTTGVTAAPCTDCTGPL